MAWKPDLVIPGAPGCSFAIFWARAQLLPPTLSSTASTSLLHVGFPNLFTYRELEDGGDSKQHMYIVLLAMLPGQPASSLWV